MGNCTGMAKPINNQNSAKYPQKAAVPKSDTQTVLASKVQNQNNSNVKQSNLQAAQQSNIQSKVQVPQQAKSQLQKSNIQVGLSKKEPAAPPAQQPSQPNIKVSQAVVAHQQQGRVQQALKNSQYVGGQNVPSWIEGSKTPANQSLRKSAVQAQNDSHNVAVSWMNVSHTPSSSKVNTSSVGREVEKNQRQLKGQNLLLQKNLEQKMIVIQEQQPGQSSLSKPNSMNNSQKLLASGSKGIKKEDTSILLNKKNKNDEEQLGNIDQMLESEPKYGGISISDIKISQLNSNIKVRNSEAKNSKAELRPIQQSKIEQQNAEFFSSRQSDPISHEKLQVMNSAMRSEVVKYIEISKIKEGYRVNKNEESLRIEEPEQLAQLESMMIPDEDNSSPLKRIIWKSQIQIM